MSEQAMNQIQAYRQAAEAKNGLLPCPFCGGGAELGDGRFHDWKVNCEKCWAEITHVDHDTVIKLWNTRTPAIPALCEALEYALRFKGTLCDIQPEIDKILEAG